MRTLTSQILFLAILMFSTTMWAEDDKDFRSWALSAGSKYSIIDDSLLSASNINDPFGLFLAVEHGYGKFGTEFSASSTDLRNRVSNIHTDFTDFSLRQLYYLNGQNSFTPYFFGGFTSEEADGPLNTDSNFLFAGFGFQTPLAESLSLWADIRKPIVDLDSDPLTETSISLGLKAFLSKSSAAPKRSSDDDKDGIPNKIDQCPTTPYGVTVDSKGCELDSDNDGVKDSKDLCPNSAAGVTVDSRGCEVEKDSDGDGVVDSADQCPNSPSGQKVNAEGCKEKVMETITANLSVNFDTDSSFVKSSYDPKIQEFASFLKKYSSAKAAITGHTDNVGNFQQSAKNIAYNLALSERRAKAVQSKLLALDVFASQLSISAKGMSEPTNSNSTAAERAQNRRVTATVSVDVEQ